MIANERRRSIIEYLSVSEVPLSATSLANQYTVSRQVIVGDIALLRAEGYDILATPRGYVMHISEKGKYIRQIACVHTRNELEDELVSIVDLGGKILDVVIEHPLYGQLIGQLQISSRYDATQFSKKVEIDNTQLLSNLTKGVHLHTIECEDEQSYLRILEVLKQKNYLYIDTIE